MKLKFHPSYRTGAFVSLLLAQVLLLMSFFINRSAGDADRIASATSRKLERRLSRLERHMADALSQPRGEWISLDALPEDMVVYRYIDDSLQAWCHQFPLANDDIRQRRIGSEKMGPYSMKPAITGIGKRPKYLSIGPKWYVVKALSDSEGCKVIGGLEVQNILLENMGGGINPHLRKWGHYSIAPLSYGGGACVIVRGRPLFKVVPDCIGTTPILYNSLMRWIALVLIITGVFFLLLWKRSILMYAISIVVLVLSFLLSIFWGGQMEDSYFFSASLYAGRWLFRSFGTMMLCSLHLVALVTFTYVVRKKLRLPSWAIAVFILLLAAYSMIALRSILVNSSIGIELHRFNELNFYSILVYAMLTLLMGSMVLLLQMFLDSSPSFLGKSVFNWRFRVIFSVVFAAILSAVIGIHAFNKEERFAAIWAEKLSIDRDFKLEIHLKEMEGAMSRDRSFPAMVVKHNAEELILNRILETYLQSEDMDYDISVSVCGQHERQKLREFNRLIMSGTPLESLSRFTYIEDGRGNSSYTGLFSTLGTDNQIYRILIRMVPKFQREYLGYYSIFSMLDNRGHFSLPPLFSHAKYINGRLSCYRGSYAYPTVLSTRTIEMLRLRDGGHIRQDRYIHFVNFTADDELVLISRPVGGVRGHAMSMGVITAIIYLALLVQAGICVRRRRPRRRYFVSRINTVMTVSLVLSMVMLTVFSITFVLRRNENNQHSIMAGKLNTVQALVEARCSDMTGPMDLMTREFSDALYSIASNTKSDITLYTPSGRAFKSTAPEVFDKLLLGVHINEDAYRKIRIENQRFFIHKEKVSGREYYALYSPVFNSKGRLIAMMCSPYTDQDYNFSRDAVYHAAIIIILFALILLLAVLITSNIVKKMFAPLLEIGEKMGASDGQLEHLEYDGDDEISSLVDAYNRMADDLTESTRRLAQAERDKAWSEMARTVAHEIKNPLTPMKLSIQRLLRLKQKQAPDWDEKFEESSRVMLEQIDVLTDTASEFLSHARLYSEEFQELDLNRLLQDQAVLFSNHDDIDFSYIGLEGAMSSGPKPQLIRVFSNLITNAIQAVDGNEGEKLVRVSLRKGDEEGFYYIVVEDNGPGVSEDNIGKLFNPNFTTKNSGSGLGLATSRSTIERCGGTINYSRSLLLKGACFTVKLPVLS